MDFNKIIRIKMKKFLASNKYRLGRGQGYVSLFFWAFTTSNLIIINLKDYVQVTLLGYFILSTLGSIAVFFIVWLIGYLDDKLKILSAEQEFQHLNSPVMSKTLENTYKILKAIHDKEEIEKFG